MRIGFIYPKVDYPPTSNMSVAAFHISKELVKKDHEIYTFNGYTNTIISNCSLLKFLRSIDVLYFRPYGPFTWDIISMIKLLKLRLPTIWFLESPANEGFSHPPYLPPVHWRWKFLAKFVDGAISVSKEVASYSKNELKIRYNTIIPNGSDPEMFSPNKFKEDIFPDLKNCVKILWVGSGRMPWHGIGIIKELASKFSVINKKVKFILITQKKFMNIANNNIMVLDEVPHTSIASYIATSNICLCLYDENYYKKVYPKNGFFQSPLKLFDYMSCAKPVIATSLGQIKEVIQNGKNGFLSNNGVDDLISKINLIINDNNLALELGKNARNSITNFYNWERVAKQTIDFFNLIKNR